MNRGGAAAKKRTFRGDERVGRADIPPMNRGGAAAKKRTFCGDERVRSRGYSSDESRLRRGHSAETSEFG